MTGAGFPRSGWVDVEADGLRLKLTTLERALWREPAFTKADLLDYYVRVAPALLPHLADRPVTLVRFPEGVERQGWYQTQCRGPAWMRTRTVAGRTGAPQSYCVVDDVASLLWLGNVGALELHPLFSRGENVLEPTVVVFDLDPGPPATILECCEVAQRLRAELERRGLQSFSKTSGLLGLHVVVPLNTPVSFEETKLFARDVAAALVRSQPEQVVDRPARALRGGKVLVDWGQNDRTKSLPAPYSLRAAEVPAVSMPLAWGQVERREVAPVGPAEALERVGRLGDLFEPVLRLEQRLPRG